MIPSNFDITTLISIIFAVKPVVLKPFCISSGIRRWCHYVDIICKISINNIMANLSIFFL